MNAAATTRDGGVKEDGANSGESGPFPARHTIINKAQKGLNAGGVANRQTRRVRKRANERKSDYTLVLRGVRTSDGDAACEAPPRGFATDERPRGRHTLINSGSSRGPDRRSLASTLNTRK